MMAYGVSAAVNSGLFQKVFVSSDDREIGRVAEPEELEAGVDEVMWDLTQAEVPYDVQLTLLDQLITARPAESVGRRREP